MPESDQGSLIVSVALDEATAVLAETPGLRVAIVARTLPAARAVLFDEAVAPDADVVYRRAVSAESITWPNGSQLVALGITQRTATRGVRLDAVVLADRVGLDELPVDWFPSFLMSQWPTQANA